jgi:hypothetical protein
VGHRGGRRWHWVRAVEVALMMRTVPWSPEIAQKLSRALGSTLVLELVGEEVRQGISQLWECSSDHHHAYCVTRLERSPVEWCIVAYEGSGMMLFGPLFVEAAKARGIPLRAHVASPVVERLLRRIGLKRSEVVLRVA